MNGRKDVDPRHDDLHLSVCDSEEKPFHCDYCGDTYQACRHWSQMDLLHEDFYV
jgi:hypothetical protein